MAKQSYSLGPVGGLAFRIVSDDYDDFDDVGGGLGRVVEIVLARLRALQQGELASLHRRLRAYQEGDMDTVRPATHLMDSAVELSFSYVSADGLPHFWLEADGDAM